MDNKEKQIFLKLSFVLLLQSRVKWGCPDLNRGRNHPKVVAYQASRQPQKTKIINQVFLRDRKNLLTFKIFEKER